MRKDYLLWKKCRIQNNNFINKFQEKDSLQLDRFQFLKINYSMAEAIKKQFSETKFL